MLISKKVALGVALAASSALVLAACGSSKSGSSSSSPSASGSSSSAAASSNAYNKGASGGTKGGTLKVLTLSDISNYDTFSMYDTNSYGLARLYSRALYSYKSSNVQADRLAVQPDAADGLPTVSADGLTYTIKLKQGVDWDIAGTGRQVTAADAIRGLKMTCNPVLPFGAAYFVNSIAGMASFCKGFGNVSQTSAKAIKAYEEGTPVTGLKAVDPMTLQITLTSKTSDFIHFLALPTAAPVNIEQLSYVPDAPDYRQHVYSDGPYVITSYSPGKQVTLGRNPVWNSSTDSLRAAYADTISLVMGGTQQGILQQIEAGTADSTFADDPVATTSIPGLLASGNTGLHINPTGGTNPYLVFNEVNGGPVMKLQVRQAINYAVDKAALSQVTGGPRINPVINQIFSQSVVGAGWQQQDVYPSPGNTGDVTKAKQLLAEAGYPNGVSIKFSYRPEGNGAKEADSLKTSLARAGISLVLKAVPNENYYGNYLQKTNNAKTGDWQMADPGWGADWEGSSERSYFTPLFDYTTYGPGTTNYGDYKDPAVNAAATAALAETDPAAAAADWNKIDAQIMNDAPWVPLVENNVTNFVGSRVKNFEWYYPSDGPDLSNEAVQ